MTDETFKRATAIKEFLSRVDKFLYFYERSGNRFWIRSKMEDFVTITTRCGYIEELELPEELKEQIVEVIREYSDRMKKEFNEL